jgi:hypothetical protein
VTEPRFEIRPLGRWDREKTGERRSSAQFKAKWPDTIALLKSETEYLGAQVVACQIDVTEGEVRRDGMLRVGAKVGFPGVKISFESVHGPLTYATDVYDKIWPHSMPGWQANVRAIALGLQALRAVDRYGITKSGEQYCGWTALSDKPASKDDLTLDDARRVFADALNTSVALLAEEFGQRDSITRMYRIAAKKYHPDAGGSESVFRLITRARDVLLAAAR